MTSPSAQKAADKRDAATRAIDRLIEQKIIGEFQRYNMGQVIRMEYEADIKAAVTEAVDAAVAPKEKRVKELEAALTGLLDAADAGKVFKSSNGDAPWTRQARKALEAPHEP